jgi:hypothetical protein
MVTKVVEHFKTFLNPFICRGKCGRELQVEYSTCNSCAVKPTTLSAIAKKSKFDENIDEIIENLTEINIHNENDFTRPQISKLAEKLGGRIEQKILKKDAVIILNDLLKKREEKRKKIEKEQDEELKNLQIISKEGEINLNGIIVLSRDDGYINATLLCKAGNKQFGSWSRTETAKKLIKSLEKYYNIESSKLVEIKQAGNSKTQGTWIHPDLAVHLAMWISSDFSIKVSHWVKQLAVCGTVTIGNEYSNNQIIELQNKIREREIYIRELDKKHNSILLKRQYYKFNKGPAFYIIEINNNQYKIGFEGENVNIRFQTYRTLVPDFKLKFLVFSHQSKLIEENMLYRYDYAKLEKNHEIIINVSLIELISSVNMFITACNLKSNIVSNDEIEKYNL